MVNLNDSADIVIKKLLASNLQIPHNDAIPSVMTRITVPLKEEIASHSLKTGVFAMTGKIYLFMHRWQKIKLSPPKSSIATSDQITLAIVRLFSYIL